MKQKNFTGGETGLGPGALCGSTAMLIPGHTFLEQQNTKKLYGTKMNHVHSQLGQILDKSCKKIKKKTQLQLLKSLEQKKEVASQSRVLDMSPAPTTT